MPFSDTAQKRLERWKQQLLDLSLRNHLLNIRDGQQAIRLSTPDIPQLEDILADGKCLDIASLANFITPEQFAEVKSFDGASEYFESVKDRAKFLLSPLAATELSRKQLELYRKCRIDQEEGDINTLFLAFGVLKYKPLGDKQFRFAPIVLVPVRMERIAAQKSFRVSQLDEDTRINTTLLELLKRDFKVEFSELDPLPTDDHGVDLQKILDIFQTKFADKEDFAIEPHLYLARLSFAKFLMWNDLDKNAEELAKQPLVEHLIEGTRGVYNDGKEVFDADKVEENTSWNDLYCPLAADSSQLTAVLYAEKGKTFVLHGPPGTGKSQSIANLICHNLAKGKRVLFVSEKKAALDVVYRRLSKLGLQPFCLELHSTHAGKAELLAQLRAVMELNDTQEPANWTNTIQQLQTRRQELNRYVATLHTPYPNGITPFQCTVEALLDDLAPSILWTPQNGLLTETADYQNSVAQALTNAQDGFAAVNANICHSLRILAEDINWDKLDKDALEQALKALSETTRKFAPALAELDGTLGIEQQETIVQNHRLALCESLKAFRALPQNMTQDFTAEAIEKLHKILDAAKNYRSAIDSVPQYDFRRINDIPVDTLRKQFDENAGKFFIAKFFANRKLGTTLASYCVQGTPRRPSDALKSDLDALAQAQTLFKTYAADFQYYGELLEKNDWLDTTPDWNLLEKQLKTVETVQKALDALKCSALVRTKLLEDENLPRIAQEYSAYLHDVQKALKPLQSAAAMPSDVTPASRIPLAELADAVDSALDALPELRAYRIWRQSRADAEALGLAPFLDALEEGALQPEQIHQEYRHRHHCEMMKQILKKDRLLADFIGAQQEHRISEFQKLDAEYQALAAKLAVAKLSEALPKARKADKPMEGTAMAFLRRECEKKSRIKPVRTILQNIEPLLPSMKPCFLMSPLSVAQYLPADLQAKFDMVVFDEASQIPVADAIGAIARGNQFICVGDRMQMPPTAFFQKSNTSEEEEDEDDVAELESILDECLAVGVESSYLNWHYRSRHESLIAFSNAHYYDNRLNTFPAARNTPTLGVHFEFQQDAVMERKSRVNHKEADAIVKYVANMLADPKQAKKTIGVVTFNISQCELIQDKFEEFRLAHPECEAAFDDSTEEPFFVKNLENVQGDERDVILFSVGYAPDADGKLFMNFGPLNRAGGERRLNVAITRAKERVVVFSSIHSTQIDLGRTSANGAKHLKEFLEYAEFGLGLQKPSHSSEDAGSAFQNTVASALEEKGFAVDRNVGCSRFRVDLAVKNPEKKEEYLLGIICDNDRDASGLTCRDRESTRPGVLQGLGWKLCHAWAAEWLQNPEKAKADMLSMLTTTTSEEEPHPASQTASEEPQNRSGHLQPPQTAAQTSAEEPQNQIEQLQPPQTTAEEPQNRSGRLQPPQTTPAPKPPINHFPYTPWASSANQLPSNQFQDNGRTRQLIRQYALEILKAEAPVKLPLLCNAVRKQWMNLRNTPANASLIQQEIRKSGAFIATDAAGDEIAWTSQSQCDSFNAYRTADTPETRRSLDAIPLCEIQMVLNEIMQEYPDATKEIAIKEIPKRFGFATSTAAHQKYLAELPLK